MSSNNKNDDDDDNTSKILNKIQKLQDQDKVRQEEYVLLREDLSQTNSLLSDLVKVSATGSTVAATKKIIPFQISQPVGKLVIPPSKNTPPPNPDDYPTQINVYAQNDNRPIQHMTLINDGPGELFFVVGYSETGINTQESKLNVNDQRELFNVYQVRLRSTLPTSTFRLIEGIFRTGSFAPATKANVEIRPTIQSNEKLKTLWATFDITTPITITSPTTQTFTNILNIAPGFQAPLPPGATATFVDSETGFPMPSLIPEGWIAEGFSVLANTSTDFTFRNILEVVPGTFTLVSTHSASNRGPIFNLVLNLAGQFSTEELDLDGAPTGGRKYLFTVTNDDPFDNMIGTIAFVIVLRRIT